MSVTQIFKVIQWMNILLDSEITFQKFKKLQIALIRAKVNITLQNVDKYVHIFVVIFCCLIVFWSHKMGLFLTWDYFRLIWQCFFNQTMMWQEISIFKYILLWGYCYYPAKSKRDREWRKKKKTVWKEVGPFNFLLN